ncbi:energy transducer TonB [Paraburkholderia oxyphila]|uniref:energy transducer TonB n=1 Tax=Paraburkholderia oxyphila TaxID=614212 RepID=UPI0005B92F81|nr:energy transducer TonB [Paraburkholderia oxyphila]
MIADNRRAACAVAVVVALHAALIVATMTRRDRAAPVALESRTLTAELLPPERAAAPAAIQSQPAPPPPEPLRHAAREARHVAPVQEPVAKPLPVAQSPSRQAIESPLPVAPTQPATDPAAQVAAAPAATRPVMALSAPKNVSHLDCRIAQPEYPMLSKRRGEAGIAYVHFVVGLTGRIENIELKQSSGFSRLDNAALAAMRDSACQPYTEDGQPVRAAYTQPFDFNLHD